MAAVELAKRKKYDKMKSSIYRNQNQIDLALNVAVTVMGMEQVQFKAKLFPS